MHRTQRTLLLTIGMVIAALALGSCRKVQNPMPSDLKRSGFLLNYGFKNPEAKRQILTPPIAKEFEEGHLTLLICQDLIPRSVLDSYTRLSGVKVSIVPCLETTDLHEHANSGELADLLITDSYMIHVLRDGNRLEKLDYNAIPNAAHLNPEFRELAFDPDNQYSLPLTWSTLGIAYNSRVLDETPKTWQDLFDPVDPDRSEAAGKIGLLASPHRLFSAALVHLGYSPNSLNPSEGQAAADFLISSVAKTQFHLVSPLNIISELESGKLRLAMAHSAEAARAAARNPAISFVVPSDGTWIAFDCIAILKESDPRQKEIAEDFINFLFHPTVSAALANFSMKASTNEAARAFLNSDIKFGPSYMQPTGKWEPLLVDPDDAIPEQVYQLIAPETPAAPNTL